MEGAAIAGIIVGMIIGERWRPFSSAWKAIKDRFPW